MKYLYRVVSNHSTDLILADSVDEATSIRGAFVRSVKILTPEDMPQYSVTAHAELRDSPLSGYAFCKQTGNKIYQWGVSTKSETWTGKEYKFVR